MLLFLVVAGKHIVSSQAVVQQPNRLQQFDIVHIYGLGKVPNKRLSKLEQITCLPTDNIY